MSTSEYWLQLQVDFQLEDVLSVTSRVAEPDEGTGLQESIQPLAGAGLITHADQTGEDAFLVTHELYLTQLVAHQGLQLCLHLSPFGLVVVAYPETAGALALPDLVFETKHLQVLLPFVESPSILVVVFLRGKDYLDCVDVLDDLLVYVAVNGVEQEGLKLVYGPWGNMCECEYEFFARFKGTLSRRLYNRPNSLFWPLFFLESIIVVFGNVIVRLLDLSLRSFHFLLSLVFLSVSKDPQLLLLFGRPFFHVLLAFSLRPFLSFFLFGLGVVMNMEVVIFLSLDLEIDIHTPKDISIQVFNVLSDESQHSLEALLFLNGQSDCALVFQVFRLIVDAFTLEVILKSILEGVHVFFGCICEMEFTDLDLELRWLWIAAIVKRTHRLPWCLSSIVDLFQQLQAFELSRPSHIVSFVSIKDLELIDLTGRRFQLHSFGEGVKMRRVALLHDDLHHILPLKVLLVEHGHEMHGYFLAIVQVHPRMHLFQQCFEEKFERVLVLALQQLALHCTLTILNTDVNNASSGIEEGDDSLEQCPLGLLIFQRQLEILVFCGQVLQLVFLSLVEGGAAAHALYFLHIAIIMPSIYL